MSTQTIGNTISELRKAKGSTQEELAKSVGVSTQAVSKWECKGTPDTDLLPSIADFFGVSIDKLFGRNVSDYSDLETEVAKQISKTDGNKRISAAFKHCWALEKGISGMTEIDKYNSLDYILEKDNGKVYSQMLFDSGITLMSLRKNLQYFLVMPEPECGWQKELSNIEGYQQLFNILSDIDTLKSLILLYQRENKPFTPKLLCKGA